MTTSSATVGLEMDEAVEAKFQRCCRGGRVDTRDAQESLLDFADEKGIDVDDVVRYLRKRGVAPDAVTFAIRKRAGLIMAAWRREGRSEAIDEAKASASTQSVFESEPLPAPSNKKTTARSSLQPITAMQFQAPAFGNA